MFSYSEKATKIWKNLLSNFIWCYLLSKFKPVRRFFFQNYGAFSEYLNFTYLVRRQISSPVLHSSVAVSQFVTKYDATVIMKIYNIFPLSIIMMKISPPSKIRSSPSKNLLSLARQLEYCSYLSPIKPIWRNNYIGKILNMSNKDMMDQFHFST